MKGWPWISFITTLSVLLSGPAAAAQSETQKITGKASTVFEWFNDGHEDKAQVFYQYLQLNGTNLLDGGIDFRLYGRLGKDIKNTVDADSRLYYGYLEKKNLLTDLDIKLGRQFVATSAGASMIDGLYLRYKNLGPLTLSLFGGGDVRYYSGYNAQDFVWGAEAKARFFDDLKFGLSYIQKWTDGRLANELIGADLAYDHAKALDLYSEIQFNYLSDSISYFLGGLHYYKDPNWSVRSEYLYSLPVFEATSIYSVFAVDEYQEFMTEATYRINNEGLRSFVRYSHEFYREYADADVVETGLEQLRRSNFAGYLSLLYRRDRDGQDMKGYKLQASYRLWKNLIWGAGVHIDVLERRIEDQLDETTSRRFWTDLTVPVMKQVDLEAKVESITSDLYSEYYRGRLRMNVRF